MIQLSLFGGNYIENSLRFIHDNLSDKGPLFVAFSGGKDSICTAELMRLSKLDHQLFYSFTGIDPPEVVRFIRRVYPHCIFLKPKQTFWRKLSVNVPPSDRLRWCCTLLKKEQSWKLPHKYRVFGIRAEESSRRAAYGQINHFVNKFTDHFQYYPIYHWTEADIWDFIDRQGLAYPSLYDEGFDRIGCVICPFHSEKSGRLHAIYRERWPGFFDRFEQGIADLYKKRMAQGRTMAYDSPAEFCRAWYRNKNARWYA